MNRQPDISVLIPTRGRPAKLAACLDGLSRQSLPAGRFEVLVGLDGPDDESAAVVRARGGAARLVRCPRQGYNAARNRLLAEARGRTMVSINDDVTAAPDFLLVHDQEQRAAAASGRPAIIAGYSPFRDFAAPTVFDRLCAGSSMIFFYDRMVGADPDNPAAADPGRDWGFRHCWGLNCSAPMAMVREVGGFTAFPLAYGYDDIELAWRLAARFGTPVLFRPAARADHDHRFRPAEVLDREQKLGASAWRFAGVNAPFAADLFGRDIRSPAELDYSREFVHRERAAADRVERSFLGLESIPAAAIDGPHAGAILNLIYEQHLLLKRWRWRLGLVEAAEGSNAGA